MTEQNNTTQNKTTHSATKTLPAVPRVALPGLPYQHRAIMSSSRFNWYNWSRQVGKSFALALKGLTRALKKRRLQVLLSAGQRQSRELMIKVQQHCQAMQIASTFTEHKLFENTSFKQLEIELPNAVRVIGLPANPNTARGFTGDVLLDEFAMHQHDREIWGALFPTVMRGDGALDIASTPKGRENMFYRLQNNPKFEHSTVTIHQAVADGLPVEPEELRQALHDDDLWRQEFLCEFLDRAHAFLTYEQITACEDQMLEPPVGLDQALDLVGSVSRLGNSYLGLDIGRHRDLTVFWLLERCDRELMTRGIVELRNVPFRDQFDLLRAFLGNRNIARCCIDASGLGMPLAEAAIEAFGSWRVKPVTFGLQTKEQLASAMRIKVEDQLIRIPVHESIRSDWHSVRRTATVHGNFRYQSERTATGHADRFWAACLAVRAAGQISGPPEYISGPKLRYARTGIW